MKDFFVEDAPRFDGEVVTSYFAVSSMSLRDKRGTGEQYLALTLSDKTGGMEARMWEEFASAVATCGEGCYVKVMGQVAKYPPNATGKWQITLSKMRLAAESEIEVADFVPTTKFNVDEMWAELRGYVDAFSNAELKRLVFGFLDDEKIGCGVSRSARGEGAAPCVDRRAAGTCADAGAGVPGGSAVLS